MDDGEEQLDADATADRARRASSFGAAAARYAQYRPGYAEAAIRWCLEPLDGVEPLRVVDLGAGTGILSGALARLGAEVVAVEPDPRMLAELRSALPGMRTLAASAEALPLPDQSMDAVLCGQSMHWFDLDRALPEIGRVLRPGGVLAGLWNLEDDGVGWVAWLSALTGNGTTVSRWRRDPPAGSDQAALIAGGDWFAPARKHEFDNKQPRTADSLLASLATTSRLLLMEEPQRARALAEIRDFLDSRPETSAGEFTLPLVTGVIRAVRRS